MALRKIRRSSIEADVDITPMLDIVFIMLIFFIVTATFLDETGIDITQMQGGGNSNSPPINVYLFANGSAAINGTNVNIDNIPERVQSIRAEQPQAVVILGADKAAAHGNVVKLKDRFERDSVPVNLAVRTH